MSDDGFGFPATRRSVSDKLKEFTPKDDSVSTGSSDVRRIDAAGAALGFVPREERRSFPLRKRKEVGPTVAINMRVPEDVAARFIQFCERHRMSYWEGVEELMKRADI